VVWRYVSAMVTDVTLPEGPEGRWPTRRAAVARSRLLNRLTIGWNVAEGLIAVVAGVAAGSVSLVGFGLDSGIEVSAAVILAWRLGKEQDHGCMADFDRRATRLIALSFAALAVYVGAESIQHLLAGQQPDASPVGIVLAALSLVSMPLLARAKRRLAPVLGSQAVASEADQTSLCALLSGVLLVGLLLNAALGWWWADPAAGVGIAAVAGLEAVRTWRADALDDTCCAA
jgi:divalent metal cation (Fe/Co/Zn/Cd) transporter